MKRNSPRHDSKAVPPDFVMWNSVPLENRVGWIRHWFGSELDKRASFTARGIGIREPMFNANVERNAGTGDWLLMYLHEPARLNADSHATLQPAKTMVVWPPGARQFYSWGRSPSIEPHSWIHCEGTWVRQQINDNRIPVNTPFVVADDSLIVEPLTMICDEMTHRTGPDPIIMHNLFQNWMRTLARCLGTSSAPAAIPDNMLQVKSYLDDHFTERIVLEKLASTVFLSRSHLCNQFRRHFGITVGNYVVRRRMSVAQRLLYDVNLRPGEIASAVGYPDIYQFSRQFRKTFGISPTEYRRRQFHS